MRYKVVLSKNEDGYAVHCPGLRGCWSQGATEQEALDNIQNAIAECLATRMLARAPNSCDNCVDFSGRRFRLVGTFRDETSVHLAEV